MENTFSGEMYPVSFLNLLGEEGEEQHHKTHTWFKARTSNNEKIRRVPKVSFITKSEVLHLDDGYKWRKYGQKPVKNSPFPRSYYRCTTSWCDVKKRVERSYSDPSTVITTYQGHHTHSCPLTNIFLPTTKRGSVSSSSSSRPHFGLPTSTTLPPQLLVYNNSLQGPSSFGTVDAYIINRQETGFDGDDDDDDHVVKKSRTSDGAGLLEDLVVSSQIIN